MLDDDDHTGIQRVVVNDEGQYSMWPADEELPPGWRAAGCVGRRQYCLQWIEVAWTDMRPLGVRTALGTSRNAQEESPGASSITHQTVEASLVDRLSKGIHSIAAARAADSMDLRSEIDRGYVLLRVLNTRGRTELGTRLREDYCDWAEGDFERGSGTVRLTGNLTLDWVPLELSAELDLRTLGGTATMRRTD